MAKGIQMVSEWYFDYILDSFYRSMVLNGILIRLRVPLSPTKISLYGPMVLNDTEWYSMVYHSLFFVRVDLLQSDNRRRTDGLQAATYQ